MGIAYAQLGDKEKALDALNKALSIDPDYKPAIINKKAVESLKDNESLDLENTKISVLDYQIDRTILGKI